MTEMSESEKLWASQRMEELKEGDVVVTGCEDAASLPVPDWLDKEKFYRARDVYKNHFASVNFSHLCGLLLSFYFTKNIKTLRSTGESETTTTLFHRYLATIRYIQKWYEGDVWDVNDVAHKSLAKVKSMHTRVANRMAARKDGVVYVSQWDMAVTQWAFVGPMVLFPSRIGLHGCSPEDYEALMHFWRGIGYLLGIEDRYNLCQGDHQEALAACNGVLNQYKKQVALADSSSVSMAQNVVTALNKIDPILTWGSMVTYIHELVDVPCPEVIGFLDWIIYSFLKFSMQVMIQYTAGRNLMNDLTRWKLEKAERSVPPFGFGWAKRLLSQYSTFNWW